ncbi:MAG: extracellular solute-binding protein, partial [Chloroflexota bacterium]
VLSTGSLTAVRNNATFKYNVAFVPRNVRHRAPLGGAFMVMMMGLEPEKRKAAWDFLKWLTNAENLAQWSRFTGYFAPRKSSYDLPEMQAFTSEHPDAMVGLKQLACCGYPILQVYNSIAVRKALEDEGHALLNDETTAEKAAAAAQQKADEIMMPYTRTWSRHPSAAQGRAGEGLHAVVRAPYSQWQVLESFGEWAVRPAGDSMFRVAQITDLHVRPHEVLWRDMVPTNGLLTRAVDVLRGLDPAPDVVLVTGAAPEQGLEEEYAIAREILSGLPMPVLLIPGNHDHHANMRRAFAGHPHLPHEGAFLHYVVDDYPLRLIGLDTVRPGRIGGEMCEERLAWLSARLSEAPDEPTLLFGHHPPCRIGIDSLDAFAFEGDDAMGTVIARNPQVVAIVCGHVHRPIHVPWHGSVVTTTPSTALQFPVDLRANAPPSFDLEPPAFRIHLWSSETGLISHLCYVDSYPGPYPLSNPRDHAPSGAMADGRRLRSPHTVIAMAKRSELLIGIDAARPPGSRPVPPVHPCRRRAGAVRRAERPRPAHRAVPGGRVSGPRARRL